MHKFMCVTFLMKDPMILVKKLVVSKLVVQFAQGLCERERAKTRKTAS